MSKVQLPPLENRRPSSKGSSQSVKNLHYENKMEDSQRSERNLLASKSPFSLPTDDEVFMYCQMEKQKKEEGKRGMLNQHIWEKKTATSKNALKHYKSFQGHINEKHQTQTVYKQEDKRVIQMALDICKKRKNKAESQQKQESVVEMLEQKKEMFLVTMAHGIIQSEIQILQKNTKEREQALLQSKKLLKQDEQEFTQYVEKNKQEKLQAEVAAENQAKERKNREQQLKELNIKLTSIRAEKSRNEELVVNYMENKSFIDKLAPKEWQEEKEKKRQQFIEENVERWIQEQMEEYQNEEEEYNKSKKYKSKIDKHSVTQSHQWRKMKVEEYWERAKRRDLDILVEFEDNYPIHFTKPKQLVEYFDIMEQKNLNQLSENQEIEEQFEITQSAFQKIENDMNRRTNQLQEQKDIFKKQIEELDNQIKQMKKKSEQNKNMINKEGQELFSKIEDLYKQFQGDFNVDFKNQNIIQVLSQIELYMEKQLKQLKKYDVKLVVGERKKAEKLRKQQLRQQMNALHKIETEQKNEKNLEKLMSVTKKREGRKPMEKSQPLVKEQKEEVQEVNDSDEDNKYFLEGYDLL